MRYDVVNAYKDVDTLFLTLFTAEKAGKLLGMFVF